MRKNTLPSGSAGAHSSTLTLSLLIIAAIGVLAAVPCSAADADDTTASAERSLSLGTTSKPDDAVRVRGSEAYGKLPLYFEANRGQTDAQVKFLSRGGRHVLFLTPTEAVLVLTTPPQAADEKSPTRGGKPGRLEEGTRTVLRMTFAGGNPMPRLAGLDELPGKANYFIGNDAAKWRTNVPTYARVHYQDLYPGIDLIYYGNPRQLEYDLVVRPGADPGRIVLGFQGADKLEVDADGDLVFHTAGAAIRQRKPVIYQEVDGLRRDIAGGYVLRETRTVGFKVDTYDPSRPLIIDPVLFYSTYLGGMGTDAGRAIAVDPSGNAYVTGETLSSNFPTIAGAFDTSFNGGGVFGDAFVTKVNPTGSGLVYSTYLGGIGDDQGLGIAVDGSGNAYVTGRTSSTDFPVTRGAFQTSYGGGTDDVFVTKLNSTGSALLYSTYLGGSAQDIGNGIAVDTSGSAYVTGVTSSGLAATTSFPTTPGTLAPSYIGGSSDAFVTKLTTTGSALVYSTYLGGSGSDFGFGIAVDGSGRAYVTGQTNSPGIATALAFQTSFGGVIDAFVARLNTAGAALDYLTYLGGTNADEGFAITLDSLGNAYVTGQTESANFPTTTGAFDTSLGGALDAFVTKVGPTGSALGYSTYLGGSSNDAGTGIAVDASFNAYVSGVTSSIDFPTVNPIQASSGGSFDAFVTKVNPAGSGLVYSTYLGGSGFDEGTGIAVDSLPTPNAYVVGFTSSTNFPTTMGAFQTTFGGGTSDAFVAKITEAALPPPPTVGKVTGGGTVDVPGPGIANFGFIVQARSTSGPIGGDLQYVNHARGAKVHSVMFDSFVITGNTATFGGTCTNNGVPCTFEVHVTDNGEPGTNDSFNITVDAGPTEGANETLRSGNVLIH